MVVNGQNGVMIQRAMNQQMMHIYQERYENILNSGFTTNPYPIFYRKTENNGQGKKEDNRG